MGRGVGEVYRQQGRSIWMCRYWKHGVRVVESTRTSDWDEARAFLAKQTGAIAEGKPIVTGAGNAYTFEDAVRAIEDDYTIRKRRSGLDVQRRIRLHLAPYFSPGAGGRRMDTIGADDLSAYTAARMRAGAEAATINRELAALKRMFRLGVAARRLFYVPAFRMCAEENARQGFFEADQFRAVLAYLPAWFAGPATVAYWTGWRLQAEIAPLEWRQVDTARQTLMLDQYKTKNKAGRTFPYGAVPELVAAIAEAARRRDALRARGVLPVHVFTFDDGTPILATPRTASGRVRPLLHGRCKVAWRAAVRAAGVPGRLRHDFRRTAARNLIEVGIDRKTAKEITGHKTDAVFERYQIVTDDNVRAAVERLAGLNPARATAKRSRRRT